MYETTLKIANLKITPPLALAPMVGLSHSALRCLLLEIGGVGLFFTEMLSAKRLPEENDTVSPFLIRTEDENPLIYQIFLTQNCDIEPAVRKVEKLNAQGIDINLGCPAPQLRKMGAGSALTRDSKNVSRIVKSVRRTTDLPLSVKIRLGEDNNRNRFVDFCKMLEDCGADCLIIHARMNGEKFCRKPRWSWIGKAKKHAGIPIIANGGILSHRDAKECLEVTGADGLMIGRAAAVRPWIFAEVSKYVYGFDMKPGYTVVKDIYFRFAELLQLRFRKERRLGRLKQFTHYFAGLYPFGHHLSSSVQTSSTMEQALLRADRFFDDNENLYT